MAVGGRARRLDKYGRAEGMERQLGLAVMDSRATMKGLTAIIERLRARSDEAGAIVKECQQQMDKLAEVSHAAFDLQADNARMALRLEAAREDYLSS